MLYSLEEINRRLEVYRDGGSTLQHGVTTVDEIVRVVRPANPHRRRIQMFNAGGDALVAYVGAAEDVDGDDLDPTNGWPLNQAYEYVPVADVVFKLPANVLELHTKDAIYGVTEAGVTTANIKFIEELD